MPAGLQVWLISLLLLIGNALFVAAEYGLVGARRSAMEALARRGDGRAKAVLRGLDQMPRYVSAIQVAITMFGIGIGAITEDSLSALIRPLLFGLDEGWISVLSILIVTYPLVVAGELVPKFVTLRYADRVALTLAPLLSGAVWLLTPIVVVVQWTARLLLRPVGIDMGEAEESKFSRDEFLFLVQAGRTTGALDDRQAEVLAKALRLDQLMAKHIMIHRVDVKWLDLATPHDQVLRRLSEIPHTRVPVGRGDLDDLAGIVYTQDALREFQRENPSLERILRPAEFVPESLTLDRVVSRMRAAKTQILVVQDEFGGTEGVLTLEDVVEEIFGELDDRPETDRAPIERVTRSRLTARSDVRYDELLSFLGREPCETELATESLASLLVQRLQRVPVLGDTVQVPVGSLVVENMARRRVTRVTVLLDAAPEETRR